MLAWGGDRGTRVCAIVPTGYKAYVRVFHPAEERVGSAWIRRRWCELAQQSGRQMHPAVQFDRFSWPHPPPTGSLDRQEAAALVSMLRDHTTTPTNCWFAIWHGFSQLTGSATVHAMRARGLRAWLQRRRAMRGEISNRHAISPMRTDHIAAGSGYSCIVVRSTSFRDSSICRVTCRRRICGGRRTDGGSWRRKSTSIRRSSPAPVHVRRRCWVANLRRWRCPLRPGWTSMAIPSTSDNARPWSD